MQVFNSILEYKDLKKLNQFFTKTGLVVMGKIFHAGVAQVLTKMIENSDCRIVFVRDFTISMAEKSNLIDSLKPFNIDYLVFFAGSDDFDLNDYGVFSLESEKWWVSKELVFFYVKVLNLFAPKYLYIGQKDFIEAKLILEVISVFQFDCMMQVVPSLRTKEGVLITSGLAELSDTGLESVKVFYRSLEFLQRMIQNGTREVAVLRELLDEFLMAFEAFNLGKVRFLNAVNLTELVDISSEGQALIQIEGEIEGLSFKDNLLV